METTYRERREAKADRLREWAEKRATRAAADLERAHRMADVIPLGQPILVGHYSESRDRRYRSRIDSAMDHSIENAAKADEFTRRAAGIESQIAGAIYSDDADAIARLRRRIADLEAERDRVKEYNATCRKGAPELGVLDERQRVQILGLAKIGGCFLGKGGAFPGYHLTNLSGNIARNRARLAQLAARS